jgi:hypothetical protein
MDEIKEIFMPKSGLSGVRIGDPATVYNRKEENNQAYDRTIK